MEEVTLLKLDEDMHINDLDSFMESNIFLLDVREDFEYELGHLKNAVRISINDLADNLDKIPKDEKIYVYCKSGARSEQAVHFLAASGFDAVNLLGGFSAYDGKFKQEEGVEELVQEEKVIAVDPNRVKIEASGLQCPGPLLKVSEVIEELKVGDQMEIIVTDFGFCADIEAWTKKTGHTVVKNEQEADRVVVIIQKNDPTKRNSNLVETKDGATMVVFSGDLDKALASFIIATGAKSMGKDVTMFFTFWGLNVIKNPNPPKVKKTGLDKLFSKMMPKSAEKLPVSNMNMFGLGSKMIQKVMKDKRVDALSEMITKAEKLGVKMVACSMSMDVMAIEESELLPFVEIAGVGAYLGDAEESNLNLFI